MPKKHLSYGLYYTIVTPYDGEPIYDASDDLRAQLKFFRMCAHDARRGVYGRGAIIELVYNMHVLKKEVVSNDVRTL